MSNQIDEGAAKPLRFRWTGSGIEPVGWDCSPWRVPVYSGNLLAPRRELSLTPRERRREARDGTRGRRGAKAVSRHRPLPPVEPKVETQVWTAHKFSDGVTTAWVYMPDGLKPTEAVARALDAVIRGRR